MSMTLRGFFAGMTNQCMRLLSKAFKALDARQFDERIG